MLQNQVSSSPYNNLNANFAQIQIKTPTTTSSLANTSLPQLLKLAYQLKTSGKLQEFQRTIALINTQVKIEKETLVQENQSIIQEITNLNLQNEVALFSQNSAISQKTGFSSQIQLNRFRAQLYIFRYHLNLLKKKIQKPGTTEIIILASDTLLAVPAHLLRASITGDEFDLLQYEIFFLPKLPIMYQISQENLFVPNFKVNSEDPDEEIAKSYLQNIKSQVGDFRDEIIQRKRIQFLIKSLRMLNSEYPLHFESEIEKLLSNNSMSGNRLTVLNQLPVPQNFDTKNAFLFKQILGCLESTSHFMELQNSARSQILDTVSLDNMCRDLDAIVSSERRTSQLAFKDILDALKKQKRLDRHNYIQIAQRSQRQVLTDYVYGFANHFTPPSPAPEQIGEQDDVYRKGRNKKHKRFLHELLTQTKKMKDTSKLESRKVSKICTEMNSFFEKKIKMEKEMQEKEEKARLKALKENNEEEYLKLLNKSKRGRLVEMLRQTDECLRKLGAQLVVERQKQQENAAKTDESKDEEMKDSASTTEKKEAHEQEDEMSKFLKNQNEYYTLAHKFEEKIECQPTMLTGGDLKSYQVEGLQWLVSLYNNRLNGILADEMGLGKTIQTISLLTYLYEYKNNRGPHLVIAPLSTLKNWTREFATWAPFLNVICYTGHSKERKKLQKTLRERQFNVILTQYEYIMRDKSALKKIAWNYVIMDEGHRIKNSDCKLVRDLSTYDSKHRLLLTGTPLQNNLNELWSLLHFLLPNIFNSSMNFESWFNLSNNTTDKFEMTEEEKLLIVNRLHKVLRPFLLRREKQDVENELPEKIETFIPIQLSALQKHFYKQIQQTKSVLIGNTQDPKQIKKKSLSNTIMQLRKVCNHPFLFFLHEWRENFDLEDLIRASGKFAFLDSMLPKMFAGGHRILLFSQMTLVLDLLEDYMRFRGYLFVRLDGKVKSEDRGRLVDEFNQAGSPIQIFLLSTRAGGLGLNLQSSDTVIIFDMDWNPQQDLQAQARAHRIGQKKEVRVFVLVTATPCEQNIQRCAQEKREAEAKVIKAGRFDQRSTDSDRQRMLSLLFSADNEDNGDKQFDQYEIPSNSELNRILSRSEDEFELFEEMDEEQEHDRVDFTKRRLVQKEASKDPLKNRAVIEKKIENELKMGSLHVLPPLLTMEEVPDCIRNSEELQRQLDSEKKQEFGRGKRVKKPVVYNDRMTENQFIKVAEGERNYKDVVEENMKRVNSPTSKETQDAVPNGKNGKLKQVENEEIIEEELQKEEENEEFSSSDEDDDDSNSGQNVAQNLAPTQNRAILKLPSPSLKLPSPSLKRKRDEFEENHEDLETDGNQEENEQDSLASSDDDDDFSEDEGEEQGHTTENEKLKLDIPPKKKAKIVPTPSPSIRFKYRQNENQDDE